jgi:hypothetical protein
MSIQSISYLALLQCQFQEIYIKGYDNIQGYSKIFYDIKARSQYQ